MIILKSPNKINTNLETGIHYGVINGNEANKINEFWFELFEPVYFDEDDNEITDFDMIDSDLETDTWICNTPDFEAEYNSNTNIIVIFKSNKTIKCNVCSPCYPNAGNLTEPNENGIETYTFND